MSAACTEQSPRPRSRATPAALVPEHLPASPKFGDRVREQCGKYVEKQRGVTIVDEDADDLISLAELILDLLAEVDLPNSIRGLLATLDIDRNEFLDAICGDS